VRNLRRVETQPRTANTRPQEFYVDAEVATALLDDYQEWCRETADSTRVVIDEVAEIAPSKLGRYGGDVLRSASAISNIVQESRRARIALDVATQRPVKVVPEIRDSATNVFWRDLSFSKIKARSQIDFLLGTLQLEDPALAGLLREMNRRKALREHQWFWYHQPTATVEVIQPTPPTFCIYDPDAKKSNYDIFRHYEKRSGDKILLSSWTQVPRIEAGATERKIRRKKKLSLR